VQPHWLEENVRNVQVVDVREPDEFNGPLGHVEGAKLIPLGQVPAHIEELRAESAERPIVVHCKSGVRSDRAVKLLQQAGIMNARNLKGGILAWIDRIDRSLPKY